MSSKEFSEKVFLILKQNNLKKEDLMVAAMSQLKDDEVFNDVDLFIDLVNFVIANYKHEKSV